MRKLVVRLSMLSLALPFFGLQAIPQLSLNTQNSHTETLILLVSEDSLKRQQHPLLKDPTVQKVIQQEKFSASSGKKLELLAPPLGYQRVLLLGAGDSTKLSQVKAAELGADVAAYLDKSHAQNVSVDTTALPSAESSAWFGQGIELRSYRFDKYKTKAEPKKSAQVELVVNDVKATQQALSKAQAVNQGVFLARDLVNEPAAAIYPESFAEQALELKKLGVKVEVLDVAAMEKLGMGALLAVGQGSNRPPRLVVAHWQNSKQAPLALVGKGITFDTGGYNLKTDAASIVRMTSDMAGAAAVLGTIKSLALQKAEVNVVGVMALAENMISDRAMLPGDILKSAAGLTIQVNNTDAEGRLVLADGLWYARTKFKPRAMVDIATLTGAKVGALGSYYAGLFSEHEALVQQLTVAGQQVDEEVWRLPLNSKLAGEMKSDLADLSNTGKTAGASTAAWFLQQFTGDTPWAHLDIAGNALASGDKGVQVNGGTGFGVRLLTEWALSQP
jgi:leucyl aminopeptidase